MGFVYTFLEVEFCSALEMVLRAISGVGGVNKKAIAELEKIS